MAYQVTLQPSGRVFQTEAHESLLEAALRNGVNVPYSCSGGSCGACKSRLVSGALGEGRFHDYTLSEAERGRGVFLLCSNSAASDLVLEVHEIGDVGEVPHQKIVTRVFKVERIGDHHLILTLRTPRSQTLQFLAGQHVQLHIAGDSPCDLAVASCPCNGRFLQFHLHCGKDDPFTRHVCDRLFINDTIEVDGPFGGFNLDESSSRPILFVAEGTGFAPIKGLIEHAIALELAQPMTLIWAAKGKGGHYLANLCRSWTDALDNFSFHLLPLDMGAEDGLQSLVASAMAASPSPAESDLYISASVPLTEALISAYRSHGLPQERIMRMEKRQC